MPLAVEASAICDHDGEADFHSAPGEGAWGSLPSRPNRPDHELARVPGRTLDTVISSTSPSDGVSLVKIDTEGGELDVLRGADKLLRDLPRTLLT